MEVLTRPELLTRLGSRHAVDLAVGTAWSRVLRGAYVQAGTVEDAHVRAAAAQRLLPAHAHVADRCLLWLRGVDVLPPGPPVLEAVVPRGAVVPQRTGMHLRQADLPSRDLMVWGGVRCLCPARVVVDLLRMSALVEAVVVADAVLRAGLVSLPALQEELDRHAGLRGVRQVPRVLLLADARAESPPESRVRAHLQLAGLMPVPQYEVRDTEGTWLARVDLAFPHARIAIEYDGRDVHERHDVFTRDRQRQNDLVRAGWPVLRFTAADLRTPNRLVEVVLAALLQRAA